MTKLEANRRMVDKQVRVETEYEQWIGIIKAAKDESTFEVQRIDGKIVDVSIFDIRSL